ncbi:MAG: ferredoxin-NADP reductase [Clostridiales bacterium]|nr:ferredoxin-NADP reductase [Clostridiales bacterium]
MSRIVRKEVLNSSVKLLEIEAPHIARKAQPGQFIMLRTHEDGERIPLTIADYDSDRGTVTIVFQEVGKTTRFLGSMSEGQVLTDFVGPLGIASHFEGVKKVAVIGGGLGTAIAYPQAKKLHSLGCEVHTVLGFRNKDLIIFEKEMNAVCDRILVTTDDGSNGTKGFVTDMLKMLVEEGNQYDLVIAIGPLIMMKMISSLTRQYGIRTIVSMNPVMIDGTGMCGGCRLTVGGELKFACVDGPDFDGHQVDFDEAMRRQSIYKAEERQSLDSHICRLGGGANA